METSNYLPLFISVKDKPCLVIGGGKIAHRKITTLMKYGAKVSVITKEITVPSLRKLVDESQIELMIKEIMPDQESLDELLERGQAYFMVVVATEHKVLNKRIADYCQRYHTLVNNITSPKDCNVRFGALIEGADYQIAVSSKGKEPKKAVSLRNRIKEFISH